VVQQVPAPIRQIFTEPLVSDIGVGRQPLVGVVPITRTNPITDVLIGRTGTNTQQQQQQQQQQNKPCFVAGTPLLTPHGWKPIEALRAGDLVLSRSENDPEGEVEAKVVEEVYVGHGHIIWFRVSGQQIGTSHEHPFWVRGRGWAAAETLRVGDKILTHDRRWVEVECLIDADESAVLYNLRISEHHTYFVGCDDWGFSVWAHNACAIIYWYRPAPGLQYGHLSVETITDAGTSIHTDRIGGQGDNNGTLIRFTPADVVATSTAQYTIPLPNANAAQVFQITVANTTGGTWSLQNNCYTHVADVLSKGGVTFAGERDFLRQMSKGFGFNILYGP
jgi:intein/homing endonuclease